MVTLTITQKTGALLLAKAEREGLDASQLADILLAQVLQEEAWNRAEMRPQHPLTGPLTSEELFADIEAADPL